MKQLLVKIDDGLMNELNKLPNKSEAVREAILLYLGGLGSPRAEISTIDEDRVRQIIKEELSKQTPTFVDAFVPTGRSKNDITTEIGQLEAERDEKLEYSQDYTDNKRITLEYKAKIDALWAEFHATDKVYKIN